MFPHPAVPLPTSGLAVAGMVVGIVSLFPFLLFGLVLGLVAVGLSLRGLDQVKAGRATGAGMAKAGIACGTTAAGLCVLLWIVIAAQGGLS